MDKRILLIPLALVAAVIAAVVIIGPLVYSAVAAPKDQDPFSLPTASSAPGARTAAADNGIWTVADGSQAGYTVNEVLNGKDTAVIGRTDRVSGTATVKGGQLTAARLSVDASKIATGNTGRDNYFRFTVISAGKYPEATFALASPVPLPEIGAGPTDLALPGTLSLAGQTRAVTARIQAVREGARIAAAGSIPIEVRDFGIDPPNLGFVRVEDHAQVRFRVNLSPAAG
jgi:polyisoprenoid-binding protein YceI|uniref:YceI family protein n=1 Tax=Pigmentiphaga litoralis TaxID=516702 RepID=UPI003899D49F